MNMQKIIIPQPKKDVETLSEDELLSLSEWGEHPGFEIAKKLANQFITRQAVDAMDVVTTDNLATTGMKIFGNSQMKLGIDFFLDSIQRAKEETLRRKAK